MFHVLEQSQFPVGAPTVNERLKWPRELLNGYLLTKLHIIRRAKGKRREVKLGREEKRSC